MRDLAILLQNSKVKGRMWSILSGISASSIIGVAMFTAGIAGMTIGCYEIAHHEDIAQFLDSSNKRNSALAAVGAVVLGVMYGQMPEALNNYGYQITSIPPLQLLRGTGSNIGSTCSSCLGSIEDMSSSIGSLCSSCVNTSGLGGFGGSISRYLPSMPNMNNMPNMSSLGCSSWFGMQSSSLFSGMLVMAVLFLGRGVNLHCDSSIALT